MINYLRTCFRTLFRNRSHSFLNIFGLAIGIACAALIFLWVEDEMQFDSTQVNKDNLYFVRVNAVLDGGVFTHGSSPGVLGPAIQAEIPGIKNTCRSTESDARMLFNIGNRNLYASGRYVEPSLFQMFTLPFVKGDPKRPFPQLHSMVITEKTAKKFFGDDKEVIGKTVRMDNKQDYVISGVIRDMPDNSSIQFEWVVPFENWFSVSDWAHNWGNNCLSTYVELQPGADLTAINKRLYNFVQARAPESNGHVFLFGMNSWHLYGDFQNGKPTGGGQITYVRLFSTIAWIILLVACINFMNLATARSEKRAKEVGVRKVLGSDRKRLILRFIGESIFMASLSSILAIVFIGITLPSFDLLVHKSLDLNIFKPSHFTALLMITLICGFVAGSYPALYLSSFNPAYVLKSTRLKDGVASQVRKGLVVLQFTISIVLIICTIIIYQQIQHIKSRNLGFNRDNLIEMDMRGNMNSNFEIIRDNLMQTGLIEHVALSDHSTIYGGNNTDNLTWSGKKAGNILISWRSVTPDYFATNGIKLLDGRNFYETDSINYDLHETGGNVIITRSFAKLIGEKSALGKIIHDQNDTMLTATVVGVVEDFVYGNMYGKPDPVIFFCTSPRFENTMYIRAKRTADPERVLANMEAIFKKDNPGYPFEYKFVDQQFDEMFQSEMLVSRLSRVFAALAIMITCLGLFGLAAYTAERRKKEIGIRKVLGASITGLTGLLSMHFLRLVMVSIVLAFPIAWFIMNKWLQDYSYRVEIHWWVFLITGIIALFIALVTVSFQTIKAALANPVRSLKAE